jgi:hypothetical protein
LIFTVLSLSTAQANTYYFKDTLRPNGYERGIAAKCADGQACGASAGHTFTPRRSGAGVFFQKGNMLVFCYVTEKPGSAALDTQHCKPVN